MPGEALDTTSLAPGDSGEVETTVTGSTESQPDPAEEAAAAKGWRKDFDKEGFLTAKEFLAREPLFDRIKSQSKELREMKKTIDAMAKHFTSATNAAVQAKLTELKVQRVEAIEQGNVERVEAIDHAIDETKQAKVDIPTPRELDPEIVRFTEKHEKWFNKDKKMTTFAIAYNEQYLRDNPGVSLAESLEETEQAVRKAYPEKFENPKREAPPAVESSAPAQAAGKKYTVDRLTPEQKLAYNQFVKVHKIIDHDEYFSQLEAIGELR